MEAFISYINYHSCAAKFWDSGIDFYGAILFKGVKIGAILHVKRQALSELISNKPEIGRPLCYQKPC